MIKTETVCHHCTIARLDTSRPDEYKWFDMQIFAFVVYRNNVEYIYACGADGEEQATGEWRQIASTWNNS